MTEMQYHGLMFWVGIIGVTVAQKKTDTWLFGALAAVHFIFQIVFFGVWLFE